MSHSRTCPFPSLPSPSSSHSSRAQTSLKVQKKPEVKVSPGSQAGADLWCGSVLAFLRWLFIGFPRGKVKHHRSVLGGGFSETSIS